MLGDSSIGDIGLRANAATSNANAPGNSSNSAQQPQQRGLDLQKHPISMLKQAIRPRPYLGPSAEYVAAQRQVHLPASQYHFYQQPMMLVEGQMQYVFTERGEVMLDAYNNVCTVGHSHPTFVKAVQNAASEILSNTRYLHPLAAEYTKALKSKVHPSLSVVYLVNSGSEAGDLAMRLARCHTKRIKIACLSGGYAGTTLACSGVSTSLSVGTPKGSADFAYAARDSIILPCADPYRGRFRGADSADGYVEWSKEIIEPYLSNNQKNKQQRATQDDVADENGVAAFLHEAVQGVGGQVVYPPGYLKKMYEYCRANSIVTICDEVQTGFGRSGTAFWAHELQGVVPDILTLGKPMGNGVALAAVLTTREISRNFDDSKYFNTFGGSVLACAAGLAVLSIVDRDGLQRNAREVGAAFITMLQDLQRKHEMIGDVRGVGLFIGIELVRNRETLEPATEESKHVMEEMRKHGVLIGIGGVHNNVIRIKPPLCFTVENAATFTTVLDQVLTELPQTLAAAAERQESSRMSYVFCGSNMSVTRPSSGHYTKPQHAQDDDHPCGIQSPRRAPVAGPGRDSGFSLEDRYLERNIYDQLRSSDGGQRPARTFSAPASGARQSVSLRQAVQQSLRDDDGTRGSYTSSAAALPAQRRPAFVDPTPRSALHGSTNNNNNNSVSLRDAVHRSLASESRGLSSVAFNTPAASTTALRRTRDFDDRGETDMRVSSAFKLPK